MKANVQAPPSASLSTSEITLFGIPHHINNYTYVQQYTIKYMKIENKYIFPVLMVLFSSLFIFYIHNLIPFFRIHDLITFSKNYTAKDLCLQNKSHQKRILTIPTVQVYI